ncbi:hypothetical protein BGZ46_001209 [Entomortierella lignicola]|nr:hypothetical protein BGZ46_001209 [Entomortierella lignicola]
MKFQSTLFLALGLAIAVVNAAPHHKGRNNDDLVNKVPDLKHNHQGPGHGKMPHHSGVSHKKEPDHHGAGHKNITDRRGAGQRDEVGHHDAGHEKEANCDCGSGRPQPRMSLEQELEQP